MGNSSNPIQSEKRVAEQLTLGSDEFLPQASNGKASVGQPEARQVLAEHDNSCANCNGTEDLEIHHRNGDRNENAVENLLPLCRDCHRKLHKDGLNGLEDELKPVEERSHIDRGTKTYQFDVSEELWQKWKLNVPRTKTLDERIRELLLADAENRVDDK